jgi:hypothetical protein
MFNFLFFQGKSIFFYLNCTPGIQCIAYRWPTPPCWPYEALRDGHQQSSYTTNTKKTVNGLQFIRLILEFTLIQFFGNRPFRLFGHTIVVVNLKGGNNVSEILDSEKAILTIALVIVHTFPVSLLNSFHGHAARSFSAGVFSSSGFSHELCFVAPL